MIIIQKLLRSKMIMLNLINIFKINNFIYKPILFYIRKLNFVNYNYTLNVPTYTKNVISELSISANQMLLYSL